MKTYIISDFSSSYAFVTLNKWKINNPWNPCFIIWHHNIWWNLQTLAPSIGIISSYTMTKGYYTFNNSLKKYFHFGADFLSELLSHPKPPENHKYKLFSSNICILLKCSWLTMFQVHRNVIELYLYTYYFCNFPI